MPAMQAMAGHEGDADAAIPYHRLYVGNLYYNLTADDIRQVFEPFGELAFVEMPMEPHVSEDYCIIPSAIRLTLLFICSDEPK